MAKRYGWLPDYPDSRDLLYLKIKPPIALPDRVDLRPGCSAVENQLDLSSCTANALAGNLEFINRGFEASRLFLYYNERVVINTVNEDSGAFLRDGIKTLVQKGVCSELDWPYVPNEFRIKPYESCYEKALENRIVSYHRILGLDDMLTCLAEGYPFVFGFTVYEGFESHEVAKTGVLAYPEPGERAVGGHAVLAVGYDQAEEWFIVRNSWGPEWGQSGYFTMPFKYMRFLADDMWVIRK